MRRILRGPQKKPPRPPRKVNAAVVAYDPMTVAMKDPSQVPAGVVTMR